MLPNTFTVEWLERRQHHAIERLARELLGRDVNVRYTVAVVAPYQDPEAAGAEESSQDGTHNDGR